MDFNTPTTTVLYTIEQAIKVYRKFCQKNIGKVGMNITVDQVLILIIIEKYPELSQKEIARLVFKDFASITRMIELMVKKNYLERSIKESDRRRFNLKITQLGKKTIKLLSPTIQFNRDTALKGISPLELMQLQNTLEKIINNCKS